LAMSGHAASLFASKCFSTIAYKQWAGPIGFGTQINLVGGLEEITAVIQNMQIMEEEYEWLYDPTYAYQVDAEIYPLIQRSHHTAPAIYNPETKMWRCYRHQLVGAYVFGDPEVLKPHFTTLKMAG